MMFTSLLQTGRQRLRRSTLLVDDWEHADHVGHIGVNICKHTRHMKPARVSETGPYVGLFCPPIKNISYSNLTQI